MATTYYIDGTTLSTATAVYTDAALTTCAPDGFYSDGYVAREQVGCVLQAAQTCPECETGCDSSISTSGSQGIYSLTLDVSTDTGAIVIGFNPRDIPNGIRATFDSVTYNELSAVNDGYHASTTSGNFTFVGNTADDCGISGTTYPSLTEYEYGSTTWVPTGYTQSLTVNAGDVSLGGTPGFCYMVIPKTPTTTSSTVLIEMAAPCSSAIFDIQANCPTLLTQFQSSSVEPDKETVCSATSIEYYYNVPVNGTAGTPGLYDWVFADAYGETVLDAGWYRLYSHPTADAMRVDSNGVIDLLNNCPSLYISIVRSTCSDFCDGTNYLINLNVDTYPSRTLATLTIGDVIGGSNVDGFYAYADTSTDTATGTYRIMELVSNTVVGIYQCDGTSCQGL